MEAFTPVEATNVGIFCFMSQYSASVIFSACGTFLESSWNRLNPMRYCVVWYLFVCLIVQEGSYLMTSKIWGSFGRRFFLPILFYILFNPMYFSLFLLFTGSSMLIIVSSFSSVDIVWLRLWIDMWINAFLCSSSLTRINWLVFTFSALGFLLHSKVTQPCSLVALWRI